MENRPPYLTVLVLTAAILALGIWHMIPRTDDIYFLALVLPAVALCVAGSTMLLMRLFPQQPWNVFNIFILVVFFSGLYLKASPRIINSDLLKRTSGGISSMRPSDDLQVKMQKTAEEAVNLSWNSFHIRLSYSDPSIQDVDRLLEKINSLYRSGYYKESNLKFFSMIYGAYVGEVIKRDKNGHWEMDDPVV